ncbi:MAG: tRNA (adenosine(37)-N6)-threonylcarbamoyltransferase complex dimerization subunit type 1 TsaB [Brevundimonas sp.]|uniref:tRNA (adenosine(37)-N6)-threonylcarbamoyltransferase complex dimerization subunit type 1 TsaB n=1 Tax=Brevundimonas sp. TaxID=1871086 RepID=UPI0040343716
MKVLVMDTALDACTAAVFEDGRALAERSEAMARGHQERIGVLVRDAAEEAGGFDGIDRIGVTVGPGSFTGLRVGLSFAQGLGAALGRPVIGISTLKALAASAPDPSGRLAAVIDARRGQVYLQTFIDGAPDGEPAPWDVEAARLHLGNAGAGWRLIGGGAALIAPAGAEILDLVTPTAAALAALTLAADPATAPARPLYLRAPDATPPTRLPGQARTKPVEA